MRRAPVQTQDPLPSTAGASVELPDTTAHYLRDVLRLCVGEHVELFDGEGWAFIAQLDEVSQASVRATLVAKLEADRLESPLQTTLYACIPKGDRWEWLLEKTSELGVSHIQPVISARTIVKIKPSKLDAKLERWRRIVAAASRQSGRARTPSVSAPATLQALLASLPAHPHCFAAIHADARRWGEVFDTPHRAVGLWVGPEGGWDDTERASLLDAGCHAVGLGPRVLRADTAAIAMLTLAQLHAGDIS